VSIASSELFYRTVPSAILSDGVVTVPVWAVTTMSISETYHLPPIGSTGIRAVMATHDDTITLTGVLVGAERYAWKLALETLAETSKRGSALAAFTGGALGGLVLVTSLTIRTDMQFQALAFNVSAERRDTIDVTMTLVHVPRPGVLAKVLEAGSVGVAALADWQGN
jgi:hypothetical protein